MKIVVADTGALISLGHTRQINLINRVFGEFYIANAVWVELNDYENPNFDKTSLSELHNRVLDIRTTNHLSTIMDYGESESVILYKEINADYLLIDDNKARSIAESLDVKCIGSVGLLIRAKQMDVLSELCPISVNWINSGRYFSKKLLDRVLEDLGEKPL